MKKIFYSYEEFAKDSKLLADKIKVYNPDALIAIARGGLTLGHFLAQALNIREIYTLNSIHYENSKKLDILNIFNIPNLNGLNRAVLVDDIIDSGETMAEILKLLNSQYPNCEFKVATLFYKSSAILKPDWLINEANCWIDFFWEKI